MILAALAALSLINNPSASAAAGHMTPIVVADRGNGQGDNHAASTAGAAQVRVEQAQTRAAPVVRQGASGSGQMEVRQPVVTHERGQVIQGNGMPQGVPQSVFMRGRINEQTSVHSNPAFNPAAIERTRANTVERTDFGQRFNSVSTMRERADIVTHERAMNASERFGLSRSEAIGVRGEGRGIGRFGLGRFSAGFGDRFAPLERARMTAFEDAQFQTQPEVFVRERAAEDLATNVFVVPTTTMLTPSVVEVLPPAPATFVAEPMFGGFVPFGDDVELDDVAVMNEVFAPAAFFEPTTFFVTPVGIVEPAPVALVPIAFVQPTSLALSGDIVAVSPGAVEIATSDGIETAFIGPSTLVEEEGGLVAASPVLVPGENVTVFALDNGGFIDASTVLVTGGFGAVNNVALTGVVSLTNPGLGGFVLTSGVQPTTVMLTPQTVVEEDAVPVGVMAIAPVEPVTVVGTMSNGVLVADMVTING